MEGSIGTSADEGFLWYRCVEWSSGSLLILISELGVVDVIPGDSRAQLLREAGRRFPHAGLLPAGVTHSCWAASVARRIELPCRCSTFPIDLGLQRDLRLVG